MGLKDESIFLEVIRPLATEDYSRAESDKAMINLNAMFSCMKIAAAKGGVLLAFSPTNFSNLFLALVEIGRPNGSPPNFVVWRYNNDSPGFFAGDYFVPQNMNEVEPQRFKALTCFSKFIAERMASLEAAQTE